jgi:hypothetical protein
MFKLTNTATQGRLPNKQKFRSPAKTSLICGRDGVPQVRKIDNQSPALMASAGQSLSVNHFSISFLWIVAWIIVAIRAVALRISLLSEI